MTPVATIKLPNDKIMAVIITNINNKVYHPPSITLVFVHWAFAANMDGRFAKWALGYI